ncbi:hypothetical protein [Parapedobacter soli]|uniref:hypothetical protein n=1 Tax=Parapedobacter soli TaxID=416955 RepID=UPI0021C81CD3|nr:hypothetical protein [Parapedobacter soli]
MRWLNTTSWRYLIAAVPMLLTSCGDAGDASGAAIRPETNYFSLTDYFDREAERLQQINPEITKTVAKSGDSESKNIRVTDWKGEFALFTDADINKPAWQNSYRIDSTASSVKYTATDPTLRTKEILVEKSDDGTITHIRITNQVDNMLYHTDEQLDYYTDSLYRIDKKQRVRVIGESHYTISGRFISGYPDTP